MSNRSTYEPTNHSQHSTRTHQLPYIVKNGITRNQSGSGGLSLTRKVNMDGQHRAGTFASTFTKRIALHKKKGDAFISNDFCNFLFQYFSELVEESASARQSNDLHIRQMSIPTLRVPAQLLTKWRLLDSALATHSQTHTHTHKITTRFRSPFLFILYLSKHLQCD